MSSHSHRQCIGVLGMLLPALVWLVAAWRPMDGLPQWRLLGSVSTYYHTGAVVVFVGTLAALSVYLLTYKGYRNKHHRRDRIAAIIAGSAAALVAFFPTSVPEGVPGPPWLKEYMRILHYVSAVILFASFAFFSLFLFRKSGGKKGEAPPSGKRTRKRIYKFCGIAIVICMAWAGIASFLHVSIFWPEALALEFFGVSWLVKGRVDWTSSAVRSRTLHYGRHPGRLVGDLQRAIRD